MAEVEKLEGLDGLRGIAACIVLAHHALQRAGLEWFSQGYLAVDLFFMLSGFVISLAYENRLSAGLRVLTFAKLRLVRLYPLMALGVLLGGIEIAFGVYRVAGWKPELVTQLLLVPSLWLAGSIFPLNGVQWSLFFEFAVNVFHAAIARWLSPGSLGTIILVSGAALIWTSRHFGGLDVGWSTDTFYGGFARVGFDYFAGVALLRLYRAGRLPRIMLHWSVSAIALPLVIVAAHASHWPQVTDVLTVLIAFPLMVVAGARTRMTGAALRGAIWLGAISYPVYALQIAVAMPAKLIALPNSVPIKIGYWSAISFVTVAFSWFALQYFDVPVRRWLRRATRAPQPATPSETAP